MTTPAEESKPDMDTEGEEKGSASPSQSFPPQLHGRVRPGLSDTPPTSTVIVQVAKSVDILSPSQLTSPRTSCRPLSAPWGLLQKSSACQQRPYKICYVPLVSSTSDLQASQSKRMDQPRLQTEKEPSPAHSCQTSSRLKPDRQTTGLQPPPCTPRVRPFSSSPGPNPTPPAPRFQSSPETTIFQPNPAAPRLQSPLHTTGLQLPPQTSAFQPPPHTPELPPPPITPELPPPPQTHRLHPTPKALGLQTTPHKPSLQSPLRPSGFHLLPLSTGLQPSSFTLRLQVPHQTLGLQPPSHLPEVQPSLCIPRLQPYPQTPVLQLSSCTPGLPTPRNPGVRPPHQSPELQALLYGKELHIVHLPENVQQVKVKGQRKYVCDECGRDCAKRSALEKHVRSHTGERPFPCITCGISFKTQSNLYKHNRTQSHLHNCQLSAELERSNKAELSTNCSSASEEDRYPCEGADQEAKGNCHVDLLMANSRCQTEQQDSMGIVQQDTGWSRVSATEKRADNTADGEKQDNVQPLPGQTGNRHLVLQRQKATYFAKQWVHRSSSSSVQTNESTDSGYFSHSDSPDQPLPSTGSLQGLQRQSTDTESERGSQAGQQLPSIGQGVPGSAVDDEAVRGGHRALRGSQELGEWISKLISDNKAVVDDKHLETVRPRKTLTSKQGSIDLPMPYTFKDSFHFDMKSVQGNKRSRVPSSLPAVSNQLTQKFHSLPEQVSLTVDYWPVVRSNSVPLSMGGLVCSKIASSSSCRPQELEGKPATMLLVTNSQSHSLDFAPLPHRTLVRQTALEGLPAGSLAVEWPNPVVRNKMCDSKAEQIPKLKCKSLGKDDGQKKLKKFSHERWSVYGEETFRKKYQEAKRTMHSASPLVPPTQHPHSVTAPDKDTPALLEKPPSNPLASTSVHKIPVKKHLSDPLPFGSVKVTTFNTPVCQVQFSQRKVDQRSPQQGYPDPCHIAKETKTPLIPGGVGEVPAVTSICSAETLQTGEDTGKLTASSTARETAGDTGKKLPLHQQSPTASSHKESNATRPIQRRFSHPKLVRQLSVLVPESKTIQEARGQRESKPNEVSLQQGESGISEFPSGRPPRKKQRLKLAGIGQLAERPQSGCGLTAGAALGESLQPGSVFIPDTGHERCQTTKCTKWKEGSSAEQSLPSTASGSFTAPDPTPPHCARSLPVQEAATSTSPSLHFQSLSESKREVISQGGFPTLLQAAANEVNHTGKNLHTGPSTGQWAAIVSPQVRALHLQKQDFLPKYQLKWTKKEPSVPSRPPS
ncbi:zinc finger protein 831 [Pristis pectinata]|uniref:zinc finger protein 831 n=1 Tax=Pristis pectinata TaxID=685728 RepID=UPI00223D0660|nr:zinc finger protein 831 [Pristis pectinata]XP_051887306.1 zinc finger protein 831 [Pristis pectinata]